MTSQVKTVLVFQDSKAVLTDIVVSIAPRSQAERIVFNGSVSLAKKSCSHLDKIVLPLLDSVLARMDHSSANYCITITNLGAASVTEQPIEVFGHSIDVSLFLGLFSASHGLSIASGDLFTGHIGGLTGDICMVKSLPAKLQCALISGDVSRIFIPNIADASLKMLRPKLREELFCAIAQAKEHLNVSQIGSIDELVCACFGEQQVLLAALNSGRFTDTWNEDVSDLIKTHFCGNLAYRFTQQLRKHWMQLNTVRSDELMQAWFEFHLGCKTYPTGAGAWMCSLFQSLPPQVKRHLRENPPLDKKQFLKLARFATDSDAEDVELLFSSEQWLVTKDFPSIAPEEQTTYAVLERLLHQIDPQVLARTVLAPIWEARATFQLSCASVADSQAFFEIVRAFYVHLLQRTGNIPPNADAQTYATESTALLTRAYPQKNGLRMALNEAMEPLHGGVAQVLDKMAQRLSEERQQNQINNLLATAIDPLDWNEELALANAFLDKIRRDLPPDLHELSGEELAGNWQEVVVRYVQTRNQFHQLLRTT